MRGKKRQRRRESREDQERDVGKERQLKGVMSERKKKRNAAAKSVEVKNRGRGRSEGERIKGIGRRESDRLTEKREGREGGRDERREAVSQPNARVELVLY